MKNINALLLLSLVCGSLMSNLGAAEITYYAKAVDANSTTVDTDRSYTASSKEYWFETTGEALNQGVALNNTSPRVLMLISQAREAAANQVSQLSDGKLDVSLMQLLTEDNQLVNSKHVSEPQLAQTGIFSKSAAVFTDKGAQDRGPLRLKTSQSLRPNDRFLVMVREPDSDYALKLSTTSQSVDHKRDVLASVEVTMPRTLNRSFGLLRPVSYKATLIGVDGSKVKLTTQYQNGNLNILRPSLSNIIAPINGLYELLVEATGYRNGIVFQRKGKLALAFSQPTASLVDDVVLANDLSKAQVRIMVDNYSRFEVRAVLYGTNQAGKLVPVQEAQVAQELNAGLASLPLKFDPSLLAQANVSAPFKIDNVRLYDQQQMAMLEEKNAIPHVVKPIIPPKFRW